MSIDTITKLWMAGIILFGVALYFTAYIVANREP
jgi:hypothetical protein